MTKALIIFSAFSKDKEKKSIFATTLHLCHRSVVSTKFFLTNCNDLLVQNYPQIQQLESWVQIVIVSSLQCYMKHLTAPETPPAAVFMSFVKKALFLIRRICIEDGVILLETYAKDQLKYSIFK